MNLMFSMVTMLTIKKNRLMLQCMQGTSIIQNVSMAPSMNTFLMVTIVEIHMIILDVCVNQHDTIEIFKI